MKMYIGTKIIQAEPCKAWKDDQMNKEGDEGYKVEYEGGYTSWSPKDVFEKAYRLIDNMSFGLAIEALQKGQKVARRGWNGKDMFIFMRPADELDIDFIPKVKSLPDSVKTDLTAHGETHYASGDKIKVKFNAYLCMKAADGSIVNGWLASQTDILADDWMIVGED